VLCMSYDLLCAIRRLKLYGIYTPSALATRPPRPARSILLAPLFALRPAALRACHSPRSPLPAQSGDPALCPLCCCCAAMAAESCCGKIQDADHQHRELGPVSVAAASA
jgi:hypothetical protein